MSRVIRPHHVKRFASHMERQVGAKRMPRNHPYVQAAADIADWTNPNIDDDEFLDNVGIAFGRRWPKYYVPFVPGKFTTGKKDEGAKQMSTILHEIGHCWQHRIRGDQRRYLCRKGHRTFAEVQCGHMEMEFWHWYDKTLRFDIQDALVEFKNFYHLRAADIRVARRHLKMAARDVDRGLVQHKLSKWAINWAIKNIK